MKASSTLFLGIILALSCALPLPAREIREPAIDTHDLILPQRRLIRVADGERQSKISIEKVSVRVLAGSGRVETTMDITLSNTGGTAAEASVILPVREGATFKHFSYGKNAGDYPARIMNAADARQLYGRIVSRLKDPALLEFAGYGAVKTSVFPIPANGSIQVRLVYEELPEKANGRFDYILPRSESFDNKTEWNITVEIEPDNTRPPVNVYSPTHEIGTTVLKNGNISTTLKKDQGRINPGSFKLSWQYGGETPPYMIFACPDQERPGTGYFLLTYDPGSQAAPRQQAQKREITLVLDRSGSMRGEKLAKVKEAARQIIAGLDEGERFNIIIYNEGVDTLYGQAAARNANTEKTASAWIDQISARGGTNIHEALQTALQEPCHDDALPIILFLTDGRPTIGTTSEGAIVTLAEQSNKAKRRIFTIGVGTDLNAPLLRRMASRSRASATFIQPGEDPEVKIAELFRKLHGPVASNIVLKAAPEAGRIHDTLPRPIPDLFAGSPLVITGQYNGNTPITLNLTCSGKQAEGTELASISFDPQATASISDDFVPRLWATRQIASLQESLRDLGIETTDLNRLASDPKTKEIAEEIIRLSTRFGIMCDFTSFFADDGASGIRQAALPAHARGFIGEREGADSFAMESNIQAMKSERTLNKFNRMIASGTSKGKIEAGSSPGRADAMATKPLETVYRDDIYQIGQSSYRQVNGSWVQNHPSLAGNDAKTPPCRTVIIGTPEYDAVVSKLIEENRQGVLAIDGEIMLTLGNESILLKNKLN